MPLLRKNNDLTTMATTTKGAARLRFHLSLKSSNQKTGPIPVSTSSRETCDPGCPFFKNGCYGDNYGLSFHWDAVTRGDRGVLWPDFLAMIRALPVAQLWRHNQAGDLVAPGTATGRKQLEQLTEANRGRRGWTFCHHKRTPAVVRAFKAATAQGFTVNASCHSEREADAAMAQGLRAVFVAPSSENRKVWTTEGGNRAVVCPAQRFEAMDCQTCKLCQARPGNVAVVFLAHGSGRKKAEAALAGAVANG
jgi:hypothetical protein